MIELPLGIVGGVTQENEPSASDAKYCPLVPLPLTFNSVALTPLDFKANCKSNGSASEPELVSVQFTFIP